MSDPAPRRIKIACPGCGQKLDVTDLVPFSRINCPACSFELIVPKWFNNYLLEAPEGAGGMAVVYRALDIALDREVAIKLFNPDLAAKGISPALFLQEARIAATLNHPAVVPIYSCGEYEGSAYIVMEYMGGGTLEQRLRRAKGRLPMMETCRWIRDVADGLASAREHGIVHHDVKPANILLDIDSNAKISDFGLAQAASDRIPSASLDPEKMWLSPDYVSPEKVLTGEEGPEGDVYSLGASFYHLLAGETPFRSDDLRELLGMRTERDPVSPDLIRPDITPALASLILNMMNRDPAARPDYAQIVARINDAVRAITRTAASLPASASVSAPAQPAPAQPPPPRKVLRVSSDRKGKSRRSLRSSRLVPLLLCSCRASWTNGLCWTPRPRCGVSTAIFRRNPSRSLPDRSTNRPCWTPTPRFPSSSIPLKRAMPPPGCPACAACSTMCRRPSRRSRTWGAISVPRLPSPVRRPRPPMPTASPFFPVSTAIRRTCISPRNSTHACFWDG